MTSQDRYMLAREIAEEGIILLKNERDILPLEGRTLAVFGRTQVDTIPCGTGSAFCQAEYTVSILDGLDRENIPYDKALADFYRRYSAENSLAKFGVWGSGSHFQPEPSLGEETVRNVRERCDTALFVIGRTAGENDDASLTVGDYRLSEIEREQLALVCSYFGDVIVVINSGCLIDLSFAEGEGIGALLWLSLCGMEGGNALARILSGRVSPSGRLTDTVARDYRAYPTAETFGKKGGLIQPYTEDIFVGYRYFETFEEAKGEVLYPFGFGLSYTKFSVLCESFGVGKEEITVRASVKNTGAYGGKETVMVFFGAPESGLARARLTLCAFAKTELLKGGETQTLLLTFPRRALASFDDSGVTGTKNAWVTEAGCYPVYLGTSVRDITPVGSVSEEKDIVWQTCVSLPTRLDKRLCDYQKTEELEHLTLDRRLGIPVPPMGECRIGADDLTFDGERYTARLMVSALGSYRFRFGGDCHVTVAGARVENGEEAVLPVGEATLFVCGEPSDVIMEKSDDTIHIGGEASIIEGGRFSETALYVVSKPFSDDGLLQKGRSLARMHTKGRYALYTLKVEKAGVYDISLRYSNPYGDMDIRDAFFFLVSNVSQDIEPVTLAHTAEEGTVFRTSEAFSLPLPAGECRLKIVSVTTTPPEIAYFIVKPSVKAAVSAEKHMTLDEGATALEAPKVKRLLPSHIGEHDLRLVARGEMTMDAFLASLTDAELAALTCGNGEGQAGYLPKHGVGEVLWADGPIGLRLAENTTIYPASAMLASTWNVALAERFGRVIGAEARAHDIGMLLAPAMNIHRDPLCGRSFEYYSEDPHLTGKMAAAVVRGVQENHVAATVKHFCANSTEYHRMRSDSYISARALREVYMKAFETVIAEGRPRVIMTSYNLVNGEKVPESKTLCEEVLRKEFHFDGVLVTDWGNNSDHVRELLAGHDLKMSFGSPERVAKAMADGSLPRERVECSARRVLNLISELECEP